MPRPQGDWLLFCCFFGARLLRDFHATRLLSMVKVGAERKSFAALADKDFASPIYHVLSDGLKKGYVTEEDKQKYLRVWGDGHTLTGGLNYYRASRLERAPKPGEDWSVHSHMASDLESFNVKVPTLVIWGLQDYPPQ
jgi:pimeloyl-ACP methyl ester carboxylesterase